MHAMWQLIKNNKAFTIVWFALLVPVFMFFATLVIDVSHLYTIKGELQNAADAGALAGAGTIYPTSSSSFPTPNWAASQTNALTFVQANKANGANLVFASISSGYWNLKNKTTTGIQPQGTTPKGICSTANSQCTKDTDCPSGEACLIQDVPAVKVRVRKPANLFFAKLFGWTSLTAGATAIAVTGFPASGAGIFPVAISTCMTDQYYAQSPLPNPPPTIYINGPYGPGGPNCDSGQWTSFTTGSNSTPTIEGFMYGTSPAPLVKVGDSIWIEPGTKAVLYKDVGNDFVGKVVVLPIVKNLSKLDTHSNMVIAGFAGFQIDGAISTGSNKQIYGHFTPFYVTAPGSSPGGPKTNTVIHPVLVQ